MNSLLTLAVAADAATAPAPQNSLLGFLPMIVIFAIFYFLLIAPMRKRQKKTQAMLSQLKKGDAVITTGGIYGRISALDESTNTVILQISDQVKVKVARSAIAGLQSEPAQAAIETKSPV